MKKKISVVFWIASFIFLFAAASQAQDNCPEGTACSPAGEIDDFTARPPQPDPTPDPCAPTPTPRPSPTPSPSPTPTPPPRGPGDLTTVPPPPTPTPPPVPDQSGAQLRARPATAGLDPLGIGDCDEPGETPVPETPQPDPTPDTEVTPSPNAGVILQGSGKLACSLQAATTSSWLHYLGFALFFLVPAIRRH